MRCDRCDAEASVVYAVAGEMRGCGGPLRVLAEGSEEWAAHQGAIAADMQEQQARGYNPRLPPPITFLYCCEACADG